MQVRRKRKRGREQGMERGRKTGYIHFKRSKLHQLERQQTNVRPLITELAEGVALEAGVVLVAGPPVFHQPCPVVHLALEAEALMWNKK